MTSSARQDQAGHDTAASRLRWLWPLLACIAGWWQTAQRIHDAPAYDAQNVYLPAARAFLSQGGTYLLTSDSLRVAPLAYLWPALWGADPSWIRMANAGLWAGCVVFLWRTACLLGRQRAGVFALVLLVVHPELSGYFPTELTEPIFLFGVFGWMYALAQMLLARQATWTMAVLGAFMLSLTLLSRPVLQMLAPAGLALCLAALAHGRLAHKAPGDPAQGVLACIATSLALGLMLPLALVVKNGLLFGLWGIGTGAGTGLYLGTHPLFQGAEPGYLGLPYDVNLLTTLKTGHGDHLSLVGDRVARSAALWQIQAMSPTEAFAFFARKLWWWLAHHPAAVWADGALLRLLRLFELGVLAVCIAWLTVGEWLRRSAQSGHADRLPRRPIAPPWAFVALLLALFLAMLAQLLPILYNSRYSSALLEPWLIPLAAWALACLTVPIGRRSVPGASPWTALALLGGVLAATAIGYRWAGEHERVAIDPAHLGPTRVHLNLVTPDRVEVQGMRPQGDKSWVITDTPATLLVRIDASEVEHISAARIFTAFWKTDLAVQAKGQHCESAEFSFQTASGRILQPAYTLPLVLPLHGDGAYHPLITHAHAEMTPREPGSLRIVLHCPTGTMVQWRGTQFLEGRYPWSLLTHIQPRLP